MKATKFTLAASVALATMIATGASASADVTDVALKDQNAEVVSTNDEINTFAEEDEAEEDTESEEDTTSDDESVKEDTDATSDEEADENENEADEEEADEDENADEETSDEEADEDENADEDATKDENADEEADENADKDDDAATIQTFFVDTKGKKLADPADGIVEFQTIEGYVLVGSEMDDEGNLTYIYSGQTTVNFTAQFNDDRADAKFSWTFPANTKITYGELFALAGLNPEDFDLGDYDFSGAANNSGSNNSSDDEDEADEEAENATVVASNAKAVAPTLFSSNIDPDASIDTGDGGSTTDLTVTEKNGEGSSNDNGSENNGAENNADNGAGNDGSNPAPTLPNTGEAEQTGLAIAGLSLMGSVAALAASRRRI